MRRVRSILAAVAAITIIVSLGLPGQALGGRLVATGHDADSHCAGYDNVGQCHFVQVAVGYVRAGAPNPSAPLLVIDCSSIGIVSTALANAGVGGGTSVVCPSANVAAFNAIRLVTSAFSAIVVGSSGDAVDLGGTADSAALSARRNDVAAFFNQGGGIFALSGGSNGDDPTDPYYQFVPIGIGGKQVAPPFRLTAEGQALGFHDSTNGIGTNDDINCCPTHNSFQEPPAGSALKVAERDSSVPPAPETLFADGTISGGTIVNKPTFGSVVGLPSNRRCVSRRKFRIRIRRPGGIKIQTALVFVNGKRVRVLTRKVLNKKRKVSTVNLRGLPKGVFKVRIVVLTSEGTTLRGTRTYRTCTKKRKSKRPPRL
jgi:hypothetical protein